MRRASCYGLSAAARLVFYCRNFAFCTVFCCSTSFSAASAAAPEPEVTFSRLDVAPVASQPELSGLVKSQTYSDIWWTHNDGGHPAELFAVDAEGQIVSPAWTKRKASGIRIHQAINVDWEDIALADGWVYVADIGNNGNARRDLGVYVIAEPNPRAIQETRPLAFIPIVYPEQSSFPPAEWHYDAESVFISGSTLFVITKHRKDGRWNRLARGANLYALDLTSISMAQPNPLVRVDHHPELAAATAADLSPDGRLLAVLTTQRLWFFSRPAASLRWFSESARAFSAPLPASIGQAEAVAWDNNKTLRIVTEKDASLFQVTISRP